LRKKLKKALYRPMDGLLLHLLGTEYSKPEFWKYFASLREDFDRLFWCFTNVPCRQDIYEDRDLVIMQFPGHKMTDTMLWRPGYLSRYGNEFSEETIELWAIEPTLDDPQKLVSEYENTYYDRQDKFIDEHAYVWLIYMYGTSWEIFARRSDWLKRLHNSLLNEKGVAIFKSQSNQRVAAFAAAGLAEFGRDNI
jgi:hypothetical protein